eukprot:6202496-Pleurochrysis_carterae.AAC.3
MWINRERAKVESTPACRTAGWSLRSNSNEEAFKSQNMVKPRTANAISPSQKRFLEPNAGASSIMPPKPAFVTSQFSSRYDAVLSDDAAAKSCGEEKAGGRASGLRSSTSESEDVMSPVSGSTSLSSPMIAQLPRSQRTQRGARCRGVAR